MTAVLVDVGLAGARQAAKRVMRRSAGGESAQATYCLRVWLEHRARITAAGVEPLRLAELGPGNSVGVGIAALLTGVERVVALDVEAYRPLGSLAMLEDLVHQLQRMAAPLPPPERMEHLHRQAYLGTIVRYVAPWDGATVVEPASMDAVISQAVLEHVDEVGATYQAMAAWLRRGGVMSHQIDLRSHRTSRAWNGHWRYSARQWAIARPPRGGMNRQPLSAHLAAASAAGLEVLAATTETRLDGIRRAELHPDWKWLSDEDLVTSAVTLVARKS